MRMPLLWRVFAGNAIVLLAATMTLVLTPATVSFPIALEELAVLAGGLSLMLVLDVALLRRALAPLRTLAAFARRVDPLAPGERAGLDAADPEVRDLAAAVDEMLDRLELERRESARRALVAQERERVRIARELHDEVGQALTAVLWMVEDGAAREAVRSALGDVRTIARRLRPEALDDLGLLPALAALTVAVQQQSGVRVARELDGAAAAGLTEDEELVVYRVAQEALTNVVRHADAHDAAVALSRGAGATTLEVRDSGRGFAPSGAHDGAGLRGMRERALLIGARLELDSGSDGTTVRLVIER
jgi:two-component system sensor histidine kinase UhpB